MINTATRNLYNSICSLIQESNLPPVNAELVLRLILSEVSMATNEAIKNEAKEGVKNNDYSTGNDTNDSIYL